MTATGMEVNNISDQIYGPGILNPHLWHHGGAGRPMLGKTRKRESHIHPGEGGEGQASLNRQMKEVIDLIAMGGFSAAASGAPKIRAQVIAHFHGHKGVGPRLTSAELSTLASHNTAGPHLHPDIMLQRQLEISDNKVYTAVYARIPELDQAFDVPESGTMEDGTPYGALGWSGPFHKIASILCHRVFISRNPSAQVPPLGSIITVEIPGGDLESKFAIWDEIVVRGTFAEYAKKDENDPNSPDSPPSRAFDKPQYIEDPEET